MPREHWFDQLSRRVAAPTLSRRTLFKARAVGAAAIAFDGALDEYLAPNADASVAATCNWLLLAPALAVCTAGLAGAGAGCSALCSTAETVITIAGCIKCYPAALATYQACVKSMYDAYCQCPLGAPICTRVGIFKDCCDPSTEDCTWQGCKPKCSICQERDPITTTCGNACASPYHCCNSVCVDYYTDANNCGGCGKPCQSGESCCNGACINLQNPCTAAEMLPCDCLDCTGSLYLYCPKVSLCGSCDRSFYPPHCGPYQNVNVICGKVQP